MPFSYFSRVLQYLSFYSTKFAQILLEQHLLLFFFAAVKTAFLKLDLFRKGNKNKLGGKKPFLQQQPILGTKLQNSIKKNFCQQNFLFFAGM